MIKSNQTLLFIGDSVTDAYRDYGNPDDLGLGYVNMLATFMKLKWPEKDFKFYNRGINGHRLIDMERVWQENCINLSPDLVTMLIGINDIWTYHHNYQTIEANYWKDFYDRYSQLIKRTQVHNQAQVVLMKVFALPYPQDRVNWQQDIFLMNQLIDRLADEHNCITVELQSKLLSLGREYGYVLYTGNDGVHPTPLGHGIIAQTWLKALGMF